MNSLNNLPSNNLQLLVKVAPYVQKAMGLEHVFSLTDQEKYICIYQGTKLKLPVSKGDLIKTGSIAYNTLKSGREVVKRIPREVLGTPYIGHGIPITDDDGHIIGTIAAGISIETQERVSDMVVDLNSFMEGISKTSNSLAQSSQELAGAAIALAQNTEGIEKNVQDMDAVITLIKEVANQTHMLGLNAAIEAARAGDLGRGFNVVAEEIRKLASKTNVSVQDINDKLEYIQTTIADFSTYTNEISAVSQQQAATMQEITANMDKIKTMALELEQIAGQLLA